MSLKLLFLAKFLAKIDSFKHQTQFEIYYALSKQLKPLLSNMSHINLLV